MFITTHTYPTSYATAESYNKYLLHTLPISWKSLFHKYHTSLDFLISAILWSEQRYQSNLRSKINYKIYNTF